MTMEKKTWPYGTKLTGPIMVQKGKLTLVLVEREAFVMVGIKHDVEPVFGLDAVIEFCDGGPTGGYWKVISQHKNPHKEQVVAILNLFPEVTWDRWAGDLGSELGIGIFGWIPRTDGKSDFIYLRIDNDGPWLHATSSAEFSSEFSRRLNFKGDGGHNHCKRVEYDFANVKCIKLKSQPQ